MFSAQGFSKLAIMFYDHIVGHMNIFGIAFDLRCLLSVSDTKSSALKCVEQTFFLSGLKVPLLISAIQVCKMLTSRF